MINVVCYKTKKPTIYNKGTKYEKQCDEFLACYGCADDEKQVALIDRLNTDEVARAEFCEKYRLDLDTIDYFFTNKQEPFDTRWD